MALTGNIKNAGNCKGSISSDFGFSWHAGI